VGSDFSEHLVTVTVNGLVPNAIYHERIEATNKDGTTVGTDVVFKTKQDALPGPPVLGKSFDVKPGTGLVLIKLLGGKGPHAAFTKGKGFIPLTEPRKLPFGTQIDARKGTLTVTTATPRIGKHKAKPQSGVTGGALFKMTQSRSKLKKGLTTLRLLESAFRGAPSFASCKAGAKDTGAHAARLSRRVLQTLHFRGHGHFSVRGRFSVGVELGTNWGTADRCDGTLTIVRRGSVRVTDLVRHKTIIVRAGHRYLALARGKKKHG
jgi:hypothetical protein